MRKLGRVFLLLVVVFVGGYEARADGQKTKDSTWIAENYDKKEYEIVMRDGAKLFTAVYSPKDKSEKYPMMLYRTPYSLKPYGEDQFRARIGPSMLFAKEKFIFVYQDVRGRFMSEGDYVNMRKHVDVKKEKKDIDESSDTYDTVEWLLKKVKNNNGKVGMWGISYPGFYAAAAVIDAHPALVAVSPQAPIADWWWDDFHHNGAFFLPHCFNFFYAFGRERPELTKEWGNRFNHGTPDGYQFFLEELGPLKNVNKFYHDSIPFWNESVKHPNYDSFWQDMNIIPHLKNVKPAVMTVGGWFDAEDLYGPLAIYEAIEENNSGINNTIVMGPWRHGGWARGDGSSLGFVHFGDDPAPSTFYQENIELPFFNYYLKGKGELKLPEAYMFETGLNQWHEFETWPPADLEEKTLHLLPSGKLSFYNPNSGYDTYDEFVSDPAKPVPYTTEITTGMTREYMTDDQRFSGRRQDVLVYSTEVLKEDITFAGSMQVKLMVSTSESACDWIVKLIDVYPDDHPGYPHKKDKKYGGYQQMVRSEAIRGRYRNSDENPEPFVPNQVTAVPFELLDVLHTFQKGHKIMIHVQSTWFPIIDRNPQIYVENIFMATEDDFMKATHRVYTGVQNGSTIKVGIWIK